MDLLKRIAKTPWHVHGPVTVNGNPDLYEIHWSEHGECVAEIVHGEVEASLIAAAPELYYALASTVCIACERRLDADPHPLHCAVCAMGRAALAKARGEVS